MLRPAPRFLFLILAIALCLRLGLLIAQDHGKGFIDRLPDQREYLSLAENLLDHGSLNFRDARFPDVRFGDPGYDGAVYAYRMPGYPLFLVACGASPFVALFVQCLVDTSTVLAVYLIAVQLTGCTRIGRIAALLMAINPFYVYFSSLILTETIFASLLVWGLHFSICFPTRTYVLPAVFFIAAAYVKPTGLIVAPVMAFTVALNQWGGHSYPLSSLHRWCLSYCTPVAVTMSLLLLVFMLPWAWRNHHILGAWIWTTTNGGVTMRDGFHDGASGASDQRFVSDIPALKSMNEVQRSDFLAQTAETWALTHPRRLSMLTVAKILRGWSPVPLSREFGKLMYRVISVSYAVPFDLLCLVGFFSPRLGRRTKLMLATPALVVTLGMALSVGSIRYRMPAEAPLAVIAAVGTMNVLKLIRVQMSKRWT